MTACSRCRAPGPTDSHGLCEHCAPNPRRAILALAAEVREMWSNGDRVPYDLDERIAALAGPDGGAHLPVLHCATCAARRVA